MLSLKEIFENSKIDEQKSVIRINDKNVEPVQYVSDIRFLWGCNQVFGFYHLFIENNLQLAKQDFFTCGILDEHIITRFEDRLLDSGIHHITLAILSDNISLVSRYADLTHPWFAHTIKSGSLIHAMQCIIKEDWQALDKDIATYERIASTQKGKINIPDLMYFKGILQKDKAMIEEALMLLLKDHKKRNKYMGIAQDYISVPALGYAKLAWLKGIEVEADHPLIPKELLPYRPLEKYEDKYDFLKLS
ncbi:Imm49 family immunity protein [Pedobacter montanisoli]|uniref:Immunity 49 family protein n=1 Tax=Pedobacter montanisoli TaxID=2923277 RepID=A0ABS9ZYB2_9SPHI|nr:Imm49 family immunity protein [Pedobacter montanisoli]MCJ0743319.1 immunity 49 family protein [Pedobacter montanisoli]